MSNNTEVEKQEIYLSDQTVEFKFYSNQEAIVKIKELIFLLLEQIIFLQKDTVVQKR